MPLLLVALGLCSCAPKPAAKGPMIVEEASHTSPPPPTELQIDRTRTGTISRADLHAVLDAGVGGFLTKLEVEPYFEERS